ncbi:hypothetical protein JCM11641_006083 [Rhodosporidiobolus odoratus]
MTDSQGSGPRPGQLADLLALRERLTRDSKVLKANGKAKVVEGGQLSQQPLDYQSSFTLILSFASSLHAAVAASAGGKNVKGPVPTVAAIEALDLILRRALSVLTLASSSFSSTTFASEVSLIREHLTSPFLLDLTSQLYATWEHHLPSAQQKLKPSLISILALASVDVLDFPQVAEQLQAKVLVGRWDSKRTLHSFEALIGRPGAKVEEFEDFAVGAGGTREGLVRRFTNAVVGNEEMAQLVGKVELAWIEKCWAEKEEEAAACASTPKNEEFWIRPSLEACRTGGAKVRHSVSTYVLQPIFAKRTEAFKAVLEAGSFLFDAEGSSKDLSEEDLETALSVLKAGNALNLVELDASAAASTKVALPSTLLLTCLAHSSTSLRTSALSLLVLATSSSIPFPIASFPLLTAFYTNSLGDEDPEFRMSMTSLSGKLLLRLRDSAWKAHRTAKKGKDGAKSAAEYVEQVKRWMDDFLNLVGKDMLNPARPYRIKINALRMLDLAFQARVDGRYAVEDLASAGPTTIGETEGPKNATTGYSTYRKTATTQTPMFHAKHRKLERNDAAASAAPASASSPTSSPVRPGSPAPSSTPTVGDETGWPFVLSLVTPETTQILLQQLLSTYTTLRFLALSILERFPAPLPGYEGPAGAEKAKSELLMPALRMIRSGREAEASAGAGAMGLVWRKWVLESLGTGRSRWTLGEVGGWQEGAETKTGPEGFAFISSLLDLTEQQLSHYSANLAEAASAAPMHGTLLALRHLFISIPVSSYDALSTPEERRALFHRALGVIRQVWEVTSPVLAAKAPEGQGEGEEEGAEEADTEEARAIRFEKDKGEEAAEPAGEEDGEVLADGTGGPQHKIILSACWRAMKEAGELLETILRLPSELGSTAFRQVWQYDEIRSIGSLFGDWLARIRHRGAFMGVHPCYTRAAAALLVAGKEWPEVGRLPEEWLDNHLNDIVSKRISFTRRSAGIPYLILGLLLTILPSSRSAFDRAFTRLFEIAESTDPQISDSARVHAMNTIRTVFLDAKGGLAASQYIERGFLVAISLFFSPTWILRNVGMMLFATLVTRALNSRRTNLDRDAASLSRRLSLDEFFGRYPALEAVLRDELERGWKESLEDSPSSTLNSSLFSILMLLSLLQTSNRVDSTLSLSAPFVPLVKACGASRVWKIREVAGDALTGLVAPNEVASTCEETLLSIERELERLSANEVHGRLLQVLSLLEGAKAMEGDHEKRVSAVYTRLGSSLLPPVPANGACRPRQPFAILATFYSISLRLPSVLSSCTPDSPATRAAAYLAQAERWQTSAYHLPSAEEFLRTCWKTAFAAASLEHDDAPVRRRRRRALAIAGLNGRSIEVKRTALEELAADLAVSAEGEEDLETASALLQFVLNGAEAGDVRVKAAELLTSSSLSGSKLDHFADLLRLHGETPIVPLREAVLPVFASVAREAKELNQALELVNEASFADQTVESRESAGLALVSLSRTLGPLNHLALSHRVVFLQAALRMLQDDDVTVRGYALEACCLRLIEAKAVERVLQAGGEELREAVGQEEEAAFEHDLALLANPSSLLFAIEKPNIFLDPFLVTSCMPSSPASAASSSPREKRLEGAVSKGRGFEEGPLGMGGNEVVRRWECAATRRA